MRSLCFSTPFSILFVRLPFGQLLFALRLPFHGLYSPRFLLRCLPWLRFVVAFRTGGRFFSSLSLSLSLLVVSLISFSLSPDRCRCLALRRLRMLSQIWKPTFSKQERPFLPSAKGEFFHSPSTLSTLSFVFSHCAICSLVVSGQLPFQLWKRTLLLHTLCCAACTWGLLGYLHMERSLSNH